MSMEQLRWYWHRWRVMSCREMWTRLWRRLRRGAMRRAITRERLPQSLGTILANADLSVGPVAANTPPPALAPCYAQRLLRAADGVCNQRITLFGVDLLLLDSPINWFSDPLRHVNFPRVPAWKFDYRRGTEPDAIMRTWWLNRHQHLIPPAIAYYTTGEERYARIVVAQLEMWLSACEYPLGPAWSTGIEIGVRLLTWAWLFRFLFARERPLGCSDAMLVAWLRSVRQHVRAIDCAYAVQSSANNHAIAEAVGVLAAVSTWPALLTETRWRRRAERVLQRECNRQIAPSGHHCEQATSYHAFVLELLLNAALLDEHVRPMLTPYIARMAGRLQQMLQDAVPPSEWGDADDAVATGILPRTSSYYAEVADAAARWLQGPPTASVAAVSTPVFWYAGDASPAATAPLAYGHDRDAVFWSGAVAPGVRAKLWLDVGSLGCGALAAHGHADALSFTLHVNDEPVITDCGTYAYHGESLWRNYFRGTRAHNTVRINAADQALARGPFLWRAHYRVRTDHAVLSDDQFDVEAEHDGYLRRFGVIHRRHIAWHPLQRVWIIEDYLQGRGACDAEVLLHLHPDRLVSTIEGGALVHGIGYTVRIEMPESLSPHAVVRGAEDPPLGWFSPRLGLKIPCHTLLAAGRVHMPARLTTRIIIEASQ